MNQSRQSRCGRCHGGYAGTSGYAAGAAVAPGDDSASAVSISCAVRPLDSRKLTRSETEED